MAETFDLTDESPYLVVGSAGIADKNPHLGPELTLPRLRLHNRTSDNQREALSLDSACQLAFASGCGRSWNWTAYGVVPFPPSLCHGARPPHVAHKPLAFHPPRGSSMRPSSPLVKKPIGYGTAIWTHFPFAKACI